MRIEAGRRELKAQNHAIAGCARPLPAVARSIAQLESNYRQVLHNERVDATAQAQKLSRTGRSNPSGKMRLELRAPQDGVVKDLATHTEGGQLSPGTGVDDDRTGRRAAASGGLDQQRGSRFVREGQTVRLKIRPYPFQKYGMVEGVVRHVSADATEQPEGEANAAGAAYRFRSIVELKGQNLEADGPGAHLPACRWMPRSRWATAPCSNTSCRRCAGVSRGGAER